ncbi:MAG TPA: homoserine kinase [Pseudogracilibacillus sp.]|nr:homoserine kinase [Pseudogracilibacillus sp.]
MFTIVTPASSANIGPGFDSIGVALSRYLTIHVEPSSHWEFIHRTDRIPTLDRFEDHYIYKVARDVARYHDVFLPPCKVIVESDIPLARGLGSSASAIVASIEMVNQLAHLNLTEKEKLAHAVRIEGHSDNVAAALLGGFVVTVQMDDDAQYKKLPTIDTDIVIYIPKVELKTSDARSVLPDEYVQADATTASGVSNLMLSALMLGDYELAGQMMESDLFHETYRAKLVPNYYEIRRKARDLGAFGTVISGAGPTMISFVKRGSGQSIAQEMNRFLNDYEVESLKIDEQGLQIIHK